MILCIKLNRLILNLFAYPPGGRSAGFYISWIIPVLKHPKCLLSSILVQDGIKFVLVEKNQNSDVFNFCNCTILKRHLTTKRERTQEKL